VKAVDAVLGFALERDDRRVLDGLPALGSESQAGPTVDRQLLEPGST